MVFLLDGRSQEERSRLIKAVLSVTHPHAWSLTDCLHFLEVLRKLFAGTAKEEAYAELREEFTGAPAFLDAAALWCFLTRDNYKDAVLKAVNLGDDTDTTGTVTGALAAN